MESKDQVDIQKKLIKPIEVIYWVGISSITLLSILIDPKIAENDQLIPLLILAVGFGLLYFHFILPRYQTRLWVVYFGAISLITIIALFSHYFGEGVHIGALYIAVVISVGIIAGRKISFHTTLFALAAEIILTFFAENRPPGFLYTLGMQMLIILIAGYITSQLTGIFHEKIQSSERQNRYLSTLLQVGLISSLPYELESTLPQIAEMIAREVPVTSCQICLLNKFGDRLEILGYFSIRKDEGGTSSIGLSFSINESPILNEVLKGGGYRVIDETQIKALLNESSCANLFLKGLKTACFLPMRVKRKNLGLILVGEVRHKKREPFTQQKLDLLHTLTTQIAAIIDNAQLFQETQDQAKRLEAVNEVATAISSTIELDDLLELIYIQLSKVSPSDTYYVGLYDSEEDILEIHIMIDKGERFPRTTIPKGKGWARWVVQNRKPLLICHLSKEKDDIPIEPIVLGNDQLSESWLGVPLIAGERALGIIAIASYSPNAFDDGDMTLLSNVATQAALALDNARQHADVKEQARRDSLTGAYNHGYLLTLLNEEIELGRKNGTSVSLIMMDIDYFKEYNDQYGHVIGDQVLQLGIQAIQSNVKNTDIVGRWGGEEFAVALPGASIEQALEIAERIQKSLTSVKIFDKSGQSIPPPTISQGIASFPLQADHTEKLVDIADMALYRAKDLGRNQIFTAE